MFNFIDNILNQITMYRLTLYVLIFYVAPAFGFSLFGLMPFEPLAILISLVILTGVCLLANWGLARIFGVSTNAESDYITALILTLIILPAVDTEGYLFLVWVGLIAMSSKYLLAIRRRHIFNPAAIAVVITFYAINQGASWWVGNTYMIWSILAGGILIVRKLRRWQMVYSVLAVSVILTVAWSYWNGVDLWLSTKTLLLYSPLIFFATIMFTEPQTTPPTKRLQVLYGIVVGVLVSPWMHFGNFYATPEIALVAGNIFSWSVSFKSRLRLILLEKRQLGANLHEFVFRSSQQLAHQPGQFLEWTLGHKADTRGNRRFFTIASSPTEEHIRLGIRFNDNSSSFKQALNNLDLGGQLWAGNLGGDFTLPKNLAQKMVWLAGGIGITPFRSMAKYLMDKNQKREVVLFYSNRSIGEIAYKDLFDDIYQTIGLQTIYTITDQIENLGWNGELGRITPEMIAKYVPDYQNYIFYISGSHQMVTALVEMLKRMHISDNNIHTDYFPGFV